MQQWCSCGAAIRTLSPRRVRAWADDHRHDVEEQPQPQKQGAYAQAELSPQDERDFADPGPYESDDVRLGFQPNP